MRRSLKKVQAKYKIKALDKSVSFELINELRSIPDRQAQQDALNNFVKRKGLYGDDLSDLMYDLNSEKFLSLKKPEVTPPPATQRPQTQAPQPQAPLPKDVVQKTPGTTLFVNGRDGWQWQLLDAAALPDEGKIMGYLGLAGGGIQGKEIISLREPVYDSQNVFIGWRPKVTFVLDKATGILDDRLGPNATKPHTDLHKHIVEILSDRRIKGMTDPDPRNFQWDDLSAADQQKVERARPNNPLDPMVP